MHTRRAAILLLVPFLLGLSASPASAGGFCTEGKITEGHTNTVDMKDFCFFPNVVRIETGETVT